MADQPSRRKMACIYDSGVLSKYAPADIQAKAKIYGLDIMLQEEHGTQKIIIPKTKGEFKDFLKFLDED